MVICYKIKLNTYDLSLSLLERNENMIIINKNIVFVTVLFVIRKNLEITLTSFHWEWINKLAYPYIGKLFNNENELIIDILYYMFKAQMHLPSNRSQIQKVLIQIIV